MIQSKDPVEFFEADSATYAEKHYGELAHSFMQTRLVRVIELLEGLALPDDAQALDAGCGPGVLVRELVARGLRVTAIDASYAMLEKARRTTGTGSDHSACFSLADIEHLPFEDGTFDLVCSTGVIEYLSDDARVLAELRRVLRPGGYLILAVTNSLSPVHWLDFFIEPMKRSDLFRRPLNAVLTRIGREPVLSRDFPVRRHKPSTFRATLADAGFGLVDDVFFHFLPWPRPLDKLAPTTTASLGRRLEKLGRSPIAGLGEGYLTLSAKKP